MVSDCTEQMTGGLLEPEEAASQFALLFWWCHSRLLSLVKYYSGIIKTDTHTRSACAHITAVCYSNLPRDLLSTSIILCCHGFNVCCICTLLFVCVIWASGLGVRQEKDLTQRQEKQIWAFAAAKKKSLRLSFFNMNFS